MDTNFIQETIDSLRTLTQLNGALTRLNSLLINEIAKESTINTKAEEIKQAVENIDLSLIENKMEEGVNNLSNKIDNIKLPEIDTTELAKESTLEEIKTEVMKVSSLDADILNGKIKIASAISQKGVSSNYTESLIDMATKIRQIPQEVNLGISDFEQIVATYPYTWNIYTVLRDLTNDSMPDYIPSYMNEYKLRYSANSVVVVEYFANGGENIELSGADGYLTSDGCFYTIANGIVTKTNKEGFVETYEAESIVHNIQSYDSKYSVWVAYFYISDSYAFAVTDNRVCRIAIEGECNSLNVESNVFSDIWNRGKIQNLHVSAGTDPIYCNPLLSVPNYIVHNSGYAISGINSHMMIFQNLEEVNGSVTTTALFKNYAPKYITLNKLTKLSGALLYGEDGVSLGSRVNVIRIPNLKTLDGNIAYGITKTTGFPYLPNLKELCMDKLEVANNHIFYISVYNAANKQGGLVSLQKVYLPSLKKINKTIVNTNVKLSANLALYEFFYGLKDFEVGELETSLYLPQWHAHGVSDKSIIVENVKNHILAKVSDRTGLTRLVFTISTELYNQISGAIIEWNGEQITLADAFLTKNWAMAGA